MEAAIMELNKKNTKDRLLRICVAAMFTALICVATMIIQIPSPLNGFVNFGDCFILIAAWVLGPWYGFAAGESAPRLLIFSADICTMFPELS